MPESNHNNRLETFCDGVFAIALTLLIIDIKIPSTATINSSVDFWQVLKHMIPSISAFVLSFFIIFITWVNHHNTLKLVHKSSGSFIYANGFLLLSVVIMPFPTSLLGEYVLSDHAEPSVILFNAVLASQAIGWILITRTALSNQLYHSEKARLQIKINGLNGSYAFVLYSLFAMLAIWFPLTIAILTTITWIFWLIYGINIKDE
ncbi:MAG: TMEM175 family protein [Saprospiraceae bacterium]